MNHVVRCKPRAELRVRDARPEVRRTRVRRDGRQRIDCLRDGGNRIAVRKSRRRIGLAHIDPARAVHIVRQTVRCAVGAALIARLDIEVALRDCKATVDVVDIVV